MFKNKKLLKIINTFKAKLRKNRRKTSAKNCGHLRSPPKYAAHPLQ